MDDRGVEAVTLHNLGWLLDLRGNPKAALGVYDEALQLLDEVGPHRRSTLLYGTARVLRHLGEFERARALLEKALDIVSDLRSGMHGSRLQTTYFATRHQLYELYVDLLMAEGALEVSKRDSSADASAAMPGAALRTRAFEASQEGRARGFLDILSEARADIRRGADPALLAEERSLQEQINVADRRYRELIETEISTQELADLSRRQYDLLTLLDRVRTRIRLSTPESISWIEPLSLTEIRRHVLDDDTLLLHYELAEDRSFAWAITKESFQSFELAGRDEIDRVAKEVSLTLAESHHRTKLGRANMATRRLSRLLLAPLTGALDRRRLVIVAEGALEYVPMAALPSPATLDTPTPRPLIVDHEIVRLPTASIVSGLRYPRGEDVPRRGRVAIVADPVFQSEDPRIAPSSEKRPGERHQEPLRPVFRRLLASRAEAKAIAAVNGQGAFLALDFMASRATVLKGHLSGYPIVHFATHAVIDTGRPELSGIVLSLVDEVGRPRDGYLRAHEIYNLDLPAELVVLSACQTALGKELDGEGLVGLTRAFMYAGARRLVVSLWKIQDGATAAFMERFYREMLVGGHSPGEALRQTQLAFLSESNWSAPFFWAGFVLLGEWRPLPQF